MLFYAIMFDLPDAWAWLDAALTAIVGGGLLIGALATFDAAAGARRERAWTALVLLCLLGTVMLVASEWTMSSVIAVELVG